MNPRIILTLEGGVLQAVTADGTVEVFLNDADEAATGIQPLHVDQVTREQLTSLLTPENLNLTT